MFPTISGEAVALSIENIAGSIKAANWFAPAVFFAFMAEFMAVFSSRTSDFAQVTLVETRFVIL